MARFVVVRLLVSIPVLLLATVIVFALVSFRGDPLAELRGRPLVSQETIRQLEEEYHLDEPVVVQYGLWLRDFVRGDWGTSYDSRRPVKDLIAQALPNTLMLVGGAMVISVIVALVVGVVSAVRQYSRFDYLATGFSYFGFSMPIFWFGLILQLVMVIFLQERFGIHLFYVQGKYSTGKEGDVVNLLRHLALPVLTLSLTIMAAWSRFQRARMLEVINSDYVRTASAKGLSRSRVVVKHALRNALIPFVTVATIDIAGLVGGAVVTERIFSWPGMGSLFIGALLQDDYPVILSWLAVASVAVILANLVADLLYSLLDPRIRYS
jgi:peptide/nickel transport system permease protein